MYALYMMSFMKEIIIYNYNVRTIIKLYFNF